MFRRFVLCLPFLLSGCELFREIGLGLIDLGARPRFAYVYYLPDEPGSSELSPVVQVATLTRGSQAQLLGTDRPFTGFSPFAGVLRWHDSGDRLAVAIEQFFPSDNLTDGWIIIYDRDLRKEFQGSDDTMLGEATRSGCRIDMPAPELEPIVRQIINLPPGSEVRQDIIGGMPVTGVFVAWLAPQRFVASVDVAPLTYIQMADGSRVDVPELTDPTDFLQPVYLAYRYAGPLTGGGNEWRIETGGCSLDRPSIPPRAAPEPTLEIADPSGVFDSGTLTADGVPVSALGRVIDNAALADGPY